MTIILQEAAGPKCACVISKKTAKRAVDRNSAKRACRELARAALAHIKRPVAFVLHIKPAALKAPRAELSKDIASLIREAVQYAE
ncbi:MAG: hypothetical protein G01um10148_109 [Parcubacteria group bacterium Gr01-1014_8]|nr:MAG: hypothetical protein G01um10148_109 [Parcubacteria group bacterium Gr01-1014_8]